MINAGLRTMKELGNETFTLYMWAQKKVMDGRIIAAIDEKNHSYTEVVLPGLETAKDASRYLDDVH